MTTDGGDFDYTVEYETDGDNFAVTETITDADGPELGDLASNMDVIPPEAPANDN